MSVTLDCFIAGPNREFDRYRVRFSETERRWRFKCEI